MSNKLNTSSINITSQSITGKCDLKCAYNFDYPTTNLVATNSGMYISLKCDNQSSAPVTFNNNKYTIEEILITSPSLHLFNGGKTAAEIIIIHIPQLGGPKLSVCVPIIQSSNSSDATNLLTEVIQLVSSGAPSSGETTTLNISNFTLNNIVPKKPFFNYNDHILGNCIVFGIMFAIPLNETTIKTLSTIIQPFKLNMVGDGNLFFNSSGPNLSTSTSGLYMSCKPTGSSVEETTVESSTASTSSTSSSSSSELSKLIPVLIALSVFAGVMLLIWIANFFLNKAPGSGELPKGKSESLADGKEGVFSGFTNFLKSKK